MTTSHTRAEPPRPARPVSRWYKDHSKRVASIVGGLVTIGGALVGIYSDPVRMFIDHHLTGLLWAAGAGVLSSSAAFVGYLTGGHRVREEMVVIEDKSFTVGPQVAIDIVGYDSVVGRPIRFLERMTNSDDLVVFIHGLGLDANDFRGYMAETRYHAIAVTMFGFDSRDRFDAHFGIISLESHLAVLESFLAWLAKQHPNKRLHLVGFSFGADILMFMAERSQGRRRPLAESVILLDPNINRTSMFISTSIGQLDLSSPLGGLKGLLDGAGSLIEFQNLCEYLHKVCSKNLAQVQRLAREVRDMWEETGYTQFLDRLGAVDSRTRRTSAVFSFHYEQNFNDLIKATGRMNFAATEMHSTEFDHFQLIGPRALHRELDAIVDRRARGS